MHVSLPFLNKDDQISEYFDSSFFLIWGLHDFNLSVILLLCCLRALRHALLERFSSALYRTAYKLLIGLFLDV